MRVVEVPGQFSIDEFAGNVGSKDDTISIARVQTFADNVCEPWLTLHYDEWICVVKGKMVIEYGDKGTILEVLAGQTVFVPKGQRFKPNFPEAGTEYIPVCLPAFRPDRCIREDDAAGAIPTKLKELHAGAAAAPVCTPAAEVLYHMCPKAQWEEATKGGDAYFPTTYDEDGGFTHATAVAERLVETANHFYQDVAGEWICLRFTRSALRRCGITVKDEEAKPVGEQAVGSTWNDWVCPHIYGGLPPSVVDATFPIVRDGKAFVRIDM